MNETDHPPCLALGPLSQTFVKPSKQRAPLTLNQACAPAGVRFCPKTLPLCPSLPTKPHTNTHRPVSRFTKTPFPLCYASRRLPSGAASVRVNGKQSCVAIELPRAQTKRAAARRAPRVQGASLHPSQSLFILLAMLLCAANHLYVSLRLLLRSTIAHTNVVIETKQRQRTRSVPLGPHCALPSLQTSSRSSRHHNMFFVSLIKPTKEQEAAVCRKGQRCA